MLSWIPSINSAGQATLIAGLCLAVLAAIAVWQRRLSAQNFRLSTALDNMSQGLCMFDAQGRIVLCNRRYLSMYQLSPQIVRPGCSLHELIQHRKDTGLLSGALDIYCQKI